MHPTGHLAGGAFAPYKRFRPGENLGAGRIHFARAFKWKGSPRGLTRGEAMPGLPKVPAAEKIDVDENGVISGLF